VSKDSLLWTGNGHIEQFAKLMKKRNNEGRSAQMKWSAGLQRYKCYRHGLYQSVVCAPCLNLSVMLSKLQPRRWP